MSKYKTALSHPTFFNKYVEMVGESGIIELLTQSYNNLTKDLNDLEKYNFELSYAENKWTITTMIRHCIDTEIIFLSRALSLARNDPKPIRSFDENQYAV